MQEMGVQAPGREDPLEEDMATHSSILAWRIPWKEEPGGYSPRGRRIVTHNRAAENACMRHKGQRP